MASFCKNCEIAYNILKNNFEWYKELSKENVNIHKQLSMLFQNVHEKQIDLSDFHVASLEARAHNLFSEINRQISNHESSLLSNTSKKYVCDCSKTIKKLGKSKKDYLQQFSLSVQEKSNLLRKHTQLHEGLLEKYTFLTEELNKLQNSYFDVLKKQLQKHSTQFIPDDSIYGEELMKRIKALEVSMKGPLKTLEINHDDLFHLDEIVNMLLHKNDLLLQKVLLEKQKIDNIKSEYEKIIRKLQSDLYEAQGMRGIKEMKRLNDNKVMHYEIGAIKEQIKVLKRLYKNAK